MPRKAITNKFCFDTIDLKCLCWTELSFWQCLRCVVCVCVAFLYFPSSLYQFRHFKYVRLFVWCIFDVFLFIFNPIFFGIYTAMHKKHTQSIQSPLEFGVAIFFCFSFGSNCKFAIWIWLKSNEKTSNKLSMVYKVNILIQNHTKQIRTISELEMWC